MLGRDLIIHIHGHKDFSWGLVSHLDARNQNAALHHDVLSQAPGVSQWPWWWIPLLCAWLVKV
jgi:hypothetical protein